MEDTETPRMRKYGESKTTRIVMATVRYVTAWAGRTKHQADGFLFDWVYLMWACWKFAAWLPGKDTALMVVIICKLFFVLRNEGVWVRNCGWALSDVSNEYTAFIFRVMRLITLKMKAVRSFETSRYKFPTTQPVAYPGILFGGFNKFSWGQRTERTGIWGR